MKHSLPVPQYLVEDMRAFAPRIEEPALVPASRVLDFSSVYAEWFRVVLRWCRSLGGPSADAEDLVQEVFVIVQRKLAVFDGANIGAWLYTITRNIVADHRRRSWFRRVILGQTPERIDYDSAHSLERKQTQQRFYHVVDRMNAKWRQPFVLFEVVGHSTDEIATLLEMPSATVRTHLARARKQFLELVRHELAKDEA